MEYTAAPGSLQRLRSHARAVIPREALSARAGHSRAAARYAPHRFGRLVDGHPDPGTGRAVSQFLAGAGVATPGASCSVSRFCTVATQLASGRDPGKAAFALANASCRSVAGAGVARRSVPARHGEPPRWDLCIHLASRID